MPRPVAAFAVAAMVIWPAFADVPVGYPPDYQATVDAATKQGKVVVYATTKQGKVVVYATTKQGKVVVYATTKQGKVVVYATTDAARASPLVKAFQAKYPGISVEYDDLNSTELYNRFISEEAAGSGTGDLLWSSAMDLQVKLVADGYALAYKSPELPNLPEWAVWKDQAYGTTAPDGAKLFLDFLLSKDGQEILANQALLYAIRNDVSGDASARRVSELVGDRARPVPIDDSLLATLKPLPRLAFLKEWRAAMRGG